MEPTNFHVSQKIKTIKKKAKHLLRAFKPFLIPGGQKSERWKRKTEGEEEEVKKKLSGSKVHPQQKGKKKKPQTPPPLGFFYFNLGQISNFQYFGWNLQFWPNNFEFSN